MGFIRHATLRAFAFVMAFILVASAPALAQSSSATLGGTVTGADGKPVAGATVTANGVNRTLHAVTAENGTFAIPNAPIGTYNVDIAGAAGKSSLTVDLTSSGTQVTVVLSTTKVIGRTGVNARPPVTGSGTDVNFGSEALARSPANGSLSSLLVQLPGAARGANGVVHINGDHGDINYIVDGVQVPQELNRSLGGEFDPSDISNIEALQGAYSAQYGERFASVLNINTKNGAGPPGFTGELKAGSFAELDSSIGYHTKLGAGNLVVAARNQRSDRGLDPPNLDSPHNNFSGSNQFLRYTAPLGNDFLNFTVSHSYNTYQIPNDVQNGEPATTDDNETQDDLFAALQYRHPIADHGSLSFGPSYKRSRIRDSGDPTNDFLYGEAGNPGVATDCAQALTSSGPIVGGVVTNPIANGGVAYSNATCGFSLNGDRTAIDIGGNLDYDNKSAHHEVRFGALYDATHVAKTYEVSLQPGNFLAPIFTPATSNAAYTVVDNAPNVGHLTAEYLQDTWRLDSRDQFDYGVRGDSFTVNSTQFGVGYGMASPRIKYTRYLGAGNVNSIYLFYGRFFTPFSLENVSPLAAYTLNLPLQTAVAQFDLKPQRDSVYEMGGHFRLGPGDLGVRVMQKNATDLIDDTQVGVTNLHQDINYAQGRIATQTAYYQLGLANAGRFYASVSHTYAVNKGCETQLLAPCFGASNDWTPADHDQRIDVTSGLDLNDRRGGWFAIDGEYGSGLSASLNPAGGISCGYPDPNTGGPCKRTPHVTFDAEKGFGLPGGMALTVRIGNLFNDRYFVTFANAQGNHEAPPRTLEVGLRLNTK